MVKKVECECCHRLIKVNDHNCPYCNFINEHYEEVHEKPSSHDEIVHEYKKNKTRRVIRITKDEFLRYFAYVFILSTIGLGIYGYYLNKAENSKQLATIIIGVAIVTLIIGLYLLIKGLFYYPSKKYVLDVTGKKYDNFNTSTDAVRYFVRSSGGDAVYDHLHKIEDWRETKLSKIDKQKHPIIYKMLLNRLERRSHHAFKFVFYRMVTAYKQNNYKKTPYKKKIVYKKYRVSDSVIILMLRENGEVNY